MPRKRPETKRSKIAKRYSIEVIKLQVYSMIMDEKTFIRLYFYLKEIIYG